MATGRQNGDIARRMGEAARESAAGVTGETPVAPAGDSPSGDDATSSEPVVQPGEKYVHITDFEKVAAERDAHKADMQRIAADFENFRKRSAREREQAALLADVKLLGELLVVLDDMERSAQHLDQASEQHPALVDGIRMMQQRLDAVLRSHGLETIDTTGQFDPHLHEAMMMQPSAEHDDGTILQTVQTGWRVGDKVLRHARVIVAGEQ